MSDVVTDKLADTRKKNLEGEISLEEVTIILKNMSNNKTPGTDGLTTESLKYFGSKLVILLLDQSTLDTLKENSQLHKHKMSYIYTANF